MATSYTWTDCGGGTGTVSSPRTYCTVYIDVTDNGNNTITLDAYAKGTIVSTGGTYIHYIQYIGIDCGGTKYVIGDQTSQNSGKGALLGSKSQGAGSEGKVYVGSRTIDKPITGTTIKMYGQNYINASPYTYSYSKSWSLGSSFFQQPGYSWVNLGQTSTISNNETVRFDLAWNQVGYYWYWPPGNGKITIYASSDGDSCGGFDAVDANGNCNMSLASSATSGSSIVSNESYFDDDSNGSGDFKCTEIPVTGGKWAGQVFVHGYDDAVAGTVYIDFTPTYSWKSLGSGSASSVSYNLSTFEVGYYLYTPTSNGTLTISSSSDYDTYGGMGVDDDLTLLDGGYGPSAVSGTKLGNTVDDYNGDTDFYVSNITVTANTTYRIYVHKYNPDSAIFGTLNIAFTPSTFTVTYDVNGGNALSTTTKSVTYGSTYGTLATPTRTGYTFDGWYTAASGGTKITSSSTVSTASNHTLYAHWTANSYTVTYDVNEGNALSTTTKSVTYDSTYGTLATPTRTGYDFSGWYTAASGGSKIESTTKVSITANQTIYAHWTAKSFTVTFNKNGGNTPSVASKFVTYDSTYGTLATCTRTGYTFKGWYTATSGGTKIESTTKVSITANQTLYAQWTANTYTVAYNANSGVGTMSNSSHTYGTSSKLTANSFTKFGYSFKGWANTLERAQAGTVDYADQASVSTLATSGTYNLYAVWEIYTKVYIYTNKKDGTSKWVPVEKYTYTGS